MVAEFENEIIDQVRTTMSISNIPIGLLKEFKKFCNEECGNTYYVGIARLLKIKEEHEQSLSLFYSLQRQIDELRLKLNGQEKRSPKTFGDE
jgi:hypothetical protein